MPVFPPSAQSIRFQTSICVVVESTIIFTLLCPLHKPACLYLKNVLSMTYAWWYFFAQLLPCFLTSLCMGVMVPYVLFQFANLGGTADTVLNIEK